MRRAIVAVALVVGLAGLTGCGASLCDKAEECAKKAGTTFSKTECENTDKTNKEKADSKGCGSQYSDLASCAAGLSCDQFNSDTGLSTNCGAKVNAYNKCMQ